MTATAHALVGGAIAASVPIPALGVTLAAASHPLLDMIPHWDFAIGWRKKNKFKLFAEASLDLIVGVTLTYLLFFKFEIFGPVDLWYLLACIFFSLIWDFAQVPYWLLKWNFPPFSTFYKIQHEIQGKAKFPLGIFTQVGTVFGILIALSFFH